MEKEKEKLRDHFKDFSFIGTSANPKSFREMAIRELYLEQIGGQK